MLPTKSLTPMKYIMRVQGIDIYAAISNRFLYNMRILYTQKKMYGYLAAFTAELLGIS